MAILTHHSVSSRNLEKLSFSLAFLNIRDPELYVSQNFPGSRILRSPNVTPASRGSQRRSKFRDDACELGVRGNAGTRGINTQ